MFESYALSAEAQLTRERVIQTVESAVQAGEARNLTPGLHQLPVRPITQNGKHTTAAVVTATSLANASGKTFFFFSFFFGWYFLSFKHNKVSLYSRKGRPLYSRQLGVCGSVGSAGHLLISSQWFDPQLFQHTC